MTGGAQLATRLKSLPGLASPGAVLGTSLEVWVRALSGLTARSDRPSSLKARTTRHRYPYPHTATKVFYANSRDAPDFYGQGLEPTTVNHPVLIRIASLPR
jgi:hypothetical protein